MNALEARDLTLTLRGGEQARVLLDGADFTIPLGGLFLFVGASGSGKSSLMRLTTGLIEPSEPAPRLRGSLRVLDHEVTSGFPTELRRHVTAVLQDEGLLDDLSPRANVELALQIADRSEKLALGLLSRVGLERPPPKVAQLSGGQRKRVAVARALAAEPDFIFFDEPTAGLDPGAARKIAELLHEALTATSRSRTIIVITHDLDAFAGLCDGVFVLLGGKVELTKLAELGNSQQEFKVAMTDGEDPALLGVRRVLLTLGSFSHTMLEAVTRLVPLFPGVVLRQVAKFVLEPLLFVLLAAATIGGLATFFALRNNPLEGALTAQVLTGAGKVLSAVLGPLLACVFFTARMAAGAAARIGTMHRSNQTHALVLMGIRPADWLLTPLVWSMGIAMPIASLAAIVVGALASLLAAQWVVGSTTIGWSEAFFRTVERSDLRFVLAKSGISGVLVAIVTYHLAMMPKRSGQDIGDAVNASIVLGLCTVLLVHGALTVVQFG